MKVFIDIALNTELLSDVASDTNYFYERLSQPVQASPSDLRAQR